MKPTHRYLTRSRGKPKRSAFIKVRDEDGDVLLTPRRKVNKKPSTPYPKNNLTFADAFAKSYIEAKGISQETNFNTYTASELRKILRDLGYSISGLNKKELIERIKKEIKQVIPEKAPETETKPTRRKQETNDSIPPPKKPRTVGFETPKRSKVQKEKDTVRSAKIVRSWKTKLDINQVPINVLKKASKKETSDGFIYLWEDKNIEELNLEQLQQVTKLVKVHHAGKEDTLRIKIKQRIDEIIEYVGDIMPVTPISKSKPIDERASAAVSVPGTDLESVAVDLDANSLALTQLEVLADSQGKDITVFDIGMNSLTSEASENPSVTNNLDTASFHERQIGVLATEDKDKPSSQFKHILGIIEDIERNGYFTEEDLDVCKKLLLDKKALLMA